MKNGLVEVEEEMAAVAKVQLTNDPENPKGVAGGRRNPKKRYGFIRNLSFYR